MGFEISGKTALVTGANRGIGKVITETLIRAGAAKVYAAVRDLESVEELKKQHGDKIEPVRIDLADPESIQQAAAKAGDVTLVVNNAGVLKTSSALADDAIESLQFEMEINVFGLMRMAQAFAPVLKSNGGGALVQLNSVASLKAFPDFATYCASKAASYSITQSLRAQLQEQGTQLLSVHPGPIDTDMGKEAGFDEADSPQMVADAIVRALEHDEFHTFPDSMAQQVGEAYQGFAKNVVEANLME